MLRERGRAVVVVCEGYDVSEGRAGGARVDGFGHIEYGASEMPAAQAVVNALNRRGLPVRGNATGQIPGIMQRATSVYRSPVDEAEAYEVGRYAVRLAAVEGSGWMATILREEESAAAGRYRAVYGKVGLDVIANSARTLPGDWIAPSGVDVTDDFLRYATPLIGTEMRAVPLRGGLQDFARLRLARVEKKLPAYVPENFREDDRAGK